MATDLMRFCQKLVRTTSAATLLNYIINMWLKSKVKDSSGNVWTVLMRDQTMYDCALTLNMVNGAMRKLKDLDLIEVMHKPHPFKPGLMFTTWIRPTDALIKAIEDDGK